MDFNRIVGNISTFRDRIVTTLHEEGYVVIRWNRGQWIIGSESLLVPNEIEKLLAQGERKFLIDYSRITFINSNGLGGLVSGYHKIKTADGKMAVVGADRVCEVCSISKVDTIFKVTDDHQEAVAYLLKSEEDTD